jgi:hypothetical protein
MYKEGFIHRAPIIHAVSSEERGIYGRVIAN